MENYRRPGEVWSFWDAAGAFGCVRCSEWFGEGAEIAYCKHWICRIRSILKSTLDEVKMVWGEKKKRRMKP